MLQLVEPSTHVKAAFLEAASELYAHGEWDITPEALAARFDQILHDLALASDPATAPPDIVPYKDFWLLDDDIWIGLLTMRLQINDRFLQTGGHIGYIIRPSRRRQGYGVALLRLGLEQARGHGLTRVLLTCDETNIGSRKIIEANGGRYENTLRVEGLPHPVRRYWIELTPSVDE
jgi:predicted acetyltransferase